MALALTALLALVIALLTLTPQAPGPDGIPGFDKLAHFVAFAALSIPLCLRYPRLWRTLALTTLAYGGLIEIIQPLTGRSADWGDLLANGAGAFAGAFAASRLTCGTGSGLIGRTWPRSRDMATTSDKCQCGTPTPPSDHHAAHATIADDHDRQYPPAHDRPPHPTR